jgi:hypothetical protein
MINFKFKSAEYYAINPSSDPQVLPAGSVLFYANSSTNFTTNFSSYKNLWKIEASNPQIIKAVDIQYAGMRYNTDVPRYVYFTTVTSGSHGSGASNNYVQRFTNDTSTFYANTNSGAHAHSVQMQAPFPKSIQITTYTSYIETNIIPKDTIIFTNNPTNDHNALPANYNASCLVSATGDTYSQVYNIPSPYWTPGQLFNRGSYTGTYDLNNSVSYSDGRGQTGRIMSSAGTHTHENTSATNGSYVLNASYPYFWTDFPPNFSAVGSHTHPSTIAYTIKLKKTRLKAYITNKNTTVSNGIIIGYKGNSNLPPNWYFCNGQIVGNYTTPNLINQYIETTNTTHNEVIEVDNTLNCNVKFSVTASTTNYHKHNLGQTDIMVSNSTKVNSLVNYHSNYDWQHNHDGWVDIDYEPAYYGVAFIIYLINT